MKRRRRANVMPQRPMAIRTPLDLNSSAEEGARWLVEYFYRLELKKLSEEDKLDLYEDIVNGIALTGEFSFKQAVRLFPRLQKEIHTQLLHLWKGGTWKAPAANLVIETERPQNRKITEPSSLFAFRGGGSFSAAFLTGAALLLHRVWPLLRVCAYRECRLFFLPRGRQIYCSHKCTKKENWAEFAPTRKRRDYKAEYAARFARPVGALEVVMDVGSRRHVRA